MPHTDCIFCKIVRGEIPSYKVWENDTHMAFLTPTPNTPGFTVVVTKNHYDSDIMQLTENLYKELMLAARRVSRHIERGLNARRVALVAEGMGIDHAHVKLIPLHGIEAGDWHPVESKETTFTESYQGYLTTHEGPPMDKQRLTEIQQAILNS